MVPLTSGNPKPKHVTLYMGISPNWGGTLNFGESPESSLNSYSFILSSFRPQNSIVLMIRTPKKVPLTLRKRTLNPKPWTASSFHFLWVLAEENVQLNFTVLPRTRSGFGRVQGLRFRAWGLRLRA